MITGAGGQLGRAAALLAPGASTFTRAQLDICDEKAVQDAVSNAHPEIVLNAAAYTDVDAAEVHEDLAHQVNADGAAIVASCATDEGAVSIFPSTNFVFAGDQGVYQEDDRTDPISAYGRSKAAGERSVARVTGSLIIRTSAVYGDGPNFISQILNAGKTNSELRVIDDQWCQPTSARDLAIASLELATSKSLGIFHVAGDGEAATWADVAQVALRAAGSSAKVTPVSTSDYYEGKPGPIAPRPSRAILDLSKARSAGVHLRAWTTGVTEYVEGI